MPSVMLRLAEAAVLIDFRDEILAEVDDIEVLELIQQRASK